MIVGTLINQDLIHLDLQEYQHNYKWNHHLFWPWNYPRNKFTFFK